MLFLLASICSRLFYGLILKFVSKSVNQSFKVTHNSQQVFDCETHLNQFVCKFQMFDD